MADLNFSVDTNPMAQTIDSVRGHVNGVTSAVVGMGEAIIATEREASQTICQNVDNGFYIMVKSQISQKAVAAYTEMSAKSMTLVQLAKALSNIQRQMESDYNMISSRYAKLFRSLNKALETRIRELDRPAMKLAEIRKNIVFDRLKDDSSMLLSSSGEVIAVKETALSGKLKQKTKDTLETLEETVFEKESYTQRVESILVKQHNAENDLAYLPALFLATESLLNNEDIIESVFTVESSVFPNSTPIAGELSRVAGNLMWKSVDKDERNAISNEFIKLCEDKISNERVSKEMMRLFGQSEWEEAVVPADEILTGAQT